MKTVRKILAEKGIMYKMLVRIGMEIEWKYGDNNNISCPNSKYFQLLIGFSPFNLSSQ